MDCSKGGVFPGFTAHRTDCLTTWCRAWYQIFISLPSKCARPWVCLAGCSRLSCGATAAQSKSTGTAASQRVQLKCGPVRSRQYLPPPCVSWLHEKYFSGSLSCPLRTCLIVIVWRDERYKLLGLWSYAWWVPREAVFSGEAGGSVKKVKGEHSRVQVRCYLFARWNMNQVCIGSVNCFQTKNAKTAKCVSLLMFFWGKKKTTTTI